MFAHPFIWQDVVILVFLSTSLGNEETIPPINKASTSTLASGSPRTPFLFLPHAPHMLAGPFVRRDVVIVFLLINIVKISILASPFHVSLSQLIIMCIILRTVVVALLADRVAAEVNKIA
uniref:Uncharacterized protein n=1 Tax=Arundo donax TaxID=35708 RepID=A0A0A9E4W7_ARUDO